MNPADIKLAVFQLEEAIKASTDGTIDVFSMSTNLAELFIEFLQRFDPDMPKAYRKLMPEPLMPMLGPIVGDDMMNAKLGRLDDLASQLGTALMLLGMTTTQLERVAKRQGPG